MFNLPNILFAGEYILVVGDLRQLPAVLVIPVYALDLGQPANNVPVQVWTLLKFVELADLRRQRQGFICIVYRHCLDAP